MREKKRSGERDSREGTSKKSEGDRRRKGVRDQKGSEALANVVQLRLWVVLAVVNKCGKGDNCWWFMVEGAAAAARGERKSVAGTVWRGGGRSMRSLGSASFTEMAGNEDEGEKASRSNEWEVVSPTTSTYAVAPGSDGDELKDDDKEDVYGAKQLSFSIQSCRIIGVVISSHLGMWHSTRNFIRSIMYVWFEQL